MRKFNNELLSRHEECLEDLKFRYTENQSLYDSMSKWMCFWDEYIEFELSCENPARLTQRGYSMLAEGDKRKHFDKKFPAIEREICRAAERFEQVNGVLFNVHGVHWADYIVAKRIEHEEDVKRRRFESKVMRDPAISASLAAKFGKSAITPATSRKRANDTLLTAIEETMPKTKRGRPDHTIIKGSVMMAKTPVARNSPACHLATKQAAAKRRNHAALPHAQSQPARPRLWSSATSTPTTRRTRSGRSSLAGTPTSWRSMAASTPTRISSTASSATSTTPWRARA